MSRQDEPEDKPKGFWEAFQHAYDEQDAEIREDTAPLHQKLGEGAVSGAFETIAHPFRWLRSLLK